MNVFDAIARDLVFTGKNSDPAALAEALGKVREEVTNKITSMIEAMERAERQAAVDAKTEPKMMAHLCRADVFEDAAKAIRAARDSWGTR